MNVRYEEDYKYVKIYFDTVPERRLIDSLKLCGWRWDKFERCWKNFNNNENREIGKAIYKQSCDQKEAIREKQEKLAARMISINDLVVRLDVFYCGKNHVLQDLMGRFQVVNKSGKIDFVYAPVAYCSTCEKYYILNDTVKELRRKGILICQLVKKEQLGEMGLSRWNEEGMLKSYGYSVNSIDGLNAEQRQTLLRLLIDKGILTKAEILSRLDWFCRMRGNDTTSNAVMRWKEDRRAISAYEENSIRRIDIY